MNCKRCGKQIEVRGVSSGFSAIVGDAIEHDAPRARHCAVCGHDFCYDCFTRWHKGENLTSSLDRMKLEVS